MALTDAGCSKFRFPSSNSLGFVRRRLNNPSGSRFESKACRPGCLLESSRLANPDDGMLEDERQQRCDDKV